MKLVMIFLKLSKRYKYVINFNFIAEAFMQWNGIELQFGIVMKNKQFLISPKQSRKGRLGNGIRKTIHKNQVHM